MAEFLFRTREGDGVGFGPRLQLRARPIIIASAPRRASRFAFGLPERRPEVLPDERIVRIAFAFRVRPVYSNGSGLNNELIALAGILRERLAELSNATNQCL